MTKFSAVRDFLWVSQAFFRGKVLRQKAYRPQGNFFRLHVSVTARRITMLMRWWGRRPMTFDEVEALMEEMSKQDDDSDRALFLDWTGSNAEEKDDGSDWDNSCRFVTVRH